MIWIIKVRRVIAIVNIISWNIHSVPMWILSNSSWSIARFLMWRWIFICGSGRFIEGWLSCIRVFLSQSDMRLSNHGWNTFLSSKQVFGKVFRISNYLLVIFVLSIPIILCMLSLLILLLLLLMMLLVCILYKLSRVLTNKRRSISSIINNFRSSILIIHFLGIISIKLLTRRGLLSNT